MSNRNGGNEMDVDKNVEFLYKAMMQRDPKKRQVKLVKPHLMQIDFGSLEDSSDDSDFKLNSDAEDDDDDIDDEDDDDNNNNPNATKSDNDDDNDDEDDEEEDGDDDDEGKNKTDQKLKEKRKSDDESANKENAKKRKLNEEGEAADDDKQSDNEDKQSSAAKSDQQQDEDDDASGKNIFKRIVVPVCSVCLGDSNNSSNEIVECDNCHETVHEGCFGVSDSHSTSSSDSSSSMEPWFCDACKAGVKPHCELCPNLGGIFKETDSGRWVHLICALYTKGIAFGDVEKLSNITLFEMPYSKWGAKECSLCEDPRFSRTGVCISCDAGMCRVHFHVTCAQRQGLLTEASPEEANVIADPYFAYCKIHADKLSMRHNHRNWLALQSNLKSDERDRGISEADKIRLQRKLGNHQMKYQEAKFNRQPCWVPKEKMPRMLLSNSYALKQLLRKAELQGVNEDVSAKDTRKRGYIPPAFSVDFVSYYLERNELMENMKGRYKEMRQQSMEMRKTEKQISQRIEELKKEIQSLSSSSMQTQRTGLTLWDFMMNIAGRRIRIPECVSFRNFARSPTKSDVDQSSTSKQLLKCAVCKLSRDQHLLANCDRCQGSYHLDCLDPPLTRMPKKTKSQGWQCSYCSKDQVEAEVEKPAEGLDKPRRLREKRLIREPLKYTTQFAHENRIRCQKDKKAKKRSNPVPSNHSCTSEANLKKAGSLPLPTSEKPKPGNSAQTPVEAATDSPLSISSGEEEEDEDEEEERSDNKPSSDDASSLDDKPQPMEVVQVREGSPRGQSPTNQLQPVKVLLKEATSSLDPMLVTNGKQGGNVITIFKASPQSAVNQLSKSPVKRVILTKVNCLDPSALPQASLNVSPQLVSSSSAVRVMPVPSEKKLPIIIRRKQPLVPEVPRTVMAVRQLTNPVAPTVSKPDEFIEISDDDDECKQ